MAEFMISFFMIVVIIEEMARSFRTENMNYLSHYMTILCFIFVLALLIKPAIDYLMH